MSPRRSDLKPKEIRWIHQLREPLATPGWCVPATVVAWLPPLFAGLGTYGLLHLYPHVLSLRLLVEASRLGLQFAFTLTLRLITIKVAT